MENRVIKFRVFGSEYMSQPFTLFDLVQRKVEFTKDVAVMQFTGLKDKSQHEIFEGDIVKCIDHPTGAENRTGVVTYHQGKWIVGDSAICTLPDLSLLILTGCATRNR